ncbi:type II toxin-antitoxin system YafQ family toxin [Chelativorans intermedius]|uniref:Type II toxin-antitoxin system YafQ family toxin n=1 Tax=Chelativorans intermedius TaxID=515947 RepID=A0ABV6D454_9HYPH|nr:type II toxin-antitoxin system YafQ family toxin [Chelativorans intermedius]MCT8997676.1 type II toxin-antitoxin system YafQ family toxin [Chelativorans intermedius]
MLVAVRSTQFKRDVKLAEKRGKDLGKLRILLRLLIEQKPLPAAYRDHPLRGRWQGFRDAHIEGDWLLIYRVVGNELQLARTGTHADLFKE